MVTTDALVDIAMATSVVAATAAAPAIDVVATVDGNACVDDVVAARVAIVVGAGAGAATDAFAAIANAAATA